MKPWRTVSVFEATPVVMRIRISRVCVTVVSNVSSAGASILAVGYLLVLIYLLASLFNGEEAGENPWHATGLEWTTQSPPLPHNFEVQPVVTEGAYEYTKREIKVV